MEVEGVEYVIDCSMFTSCLYYVRRQLELGTSAPSTSPPSCVSNVEVILESPLSIGGRSGLPLRRSRGA